MTEVPADASHEVVIEGKSSPMEQGHISVADIRELGGMPANVPWTEEDLRVGTLEVGKRPTKRVDFSPV